MNKKKNYDLNLLKERKSKREKKLFYNFYSLFEKIVCYFVINYYITYNIETIMHKDIIILLYSKCIYYFVFVDRFHVYF